MGKSNDVRVLSSDNTRFAEPAVAVVLNVASLEVRSVLFSFLVVEISEILLLYWGIYWRIYVMLSFFVRAVALSRFLECLEELLGGEC